MKVSRIIALLACVNFCTSMPLNAQNVSAGWDFDQSLQINLPNAQSGLDFSGNTQVGHDVNNKIFPVFQSLTARSPVVSGLRGQATVTQGNNLDPLSIMGEFSSLKEYHNATQVQAKASYSSEFGNGNGNVNLWAGALWQEQQVTSSSQGIRGSADSFGYNFGVDFNYAAFNLVGTYYDGEAVDVLYFSPKGQLNSGLNCLSMACSDFDKQGYILRGAYRFSDATRLGISYGESSSQLHSGAITHTNNELWSISLYHDVNSWLKFVAEYSDFKSSNFTFEDDRSSFSFGGSISW